MSTITAPEVAQPANEARERLLRPIKDEATIHAAWVKSTEAHLPMAFWRAWRNIFHAWAQEKSVPDELAPLMSHVHACALAMRDHLKQHGDFWMEREPISSGGFGGLYAARQKLHAVVHELGARKPTMESIIELIQQEVSDAQIAQMVGRGLSEFDVRDFRRGVTTADQTLTALEPPDEATAIAISQLPAKRRSLAIVSAIVEALIANPIADEHELREIDVDFADYI